MVRELEQTQILKQARCSEAGWWLFAFDRMDDATRPTGTYSTFGVVIAGIHFHFPA